MSGNDNESMTSSTSDVVAEMDYEADEANNCDYYPTTEKDFIETSITTWIKNKDLRRLTVDTVILDIPIEVLKYLGDEAMNFPITPETADSTEAGADDWSEPMSTAELQNLKNLATNLSSVAESLFEDGLDSDSEDSNPERASQTEVVRQEFRDLDKGISNAIQTLGGAVFPKVNWYCPKDVANLAFNQSLKCHAPGEVYMLLKASSRISDILDKSLFEECSSEPCPNVPAPQLILRKWLDIEPGSEYRCFVMDSKLAGISQRDKKNEYRHNLLCAEDIVIDIHNFFKGIRDKVPLKYYIFDVIRTARGNVTLIDLNVFGLMTDPYEFIDYGTLKDVYEDMILDLDEATGPQDTLEGADMFGNPVFRFVSNHDLLGPMQALYLAKRNGGEELVNLQENN